jgi:hypothetical protein
MSLRRICVMMFFLILCFSVAFAEDKPQQTTASVQKDLIRVVTPAENAQVIGKKPDIKIEFLEPIAPDTLVVILDGADITQLLDVTDKGFEFTPVMVLPAGPHNLGIIATDKNNNKLQKSISFTTRHTRIFEEAYTLNDASVIFEQVLSKPDEAKTVPNSKVEGNLGSNSKIREKGWEFTFNTNLRYLDQSLPVNQPLREGITVANWLVTGSYIKDTFKFKANIGDVQVNETQYTVAGLARRGGVLNLEYGDYQLNVFSVKSEQVFGFKGGTGIGDSLDDHIIGVSGGVKLFDKKVMFKTVYVTGGEPGSSFGISTTQGPKKGDALGFVLTSDLLQNKLRTEFEADFSRYDPDTSDEFKDKRDNAYKLKVAGNLGIYTYDAAYEYVGRDYASIGSQCIAKDKEGVTLINGINFGVQAINIMLSRYNDNVTGDDLFPRIFNYQGSLDYSFNGIPNLPIGFNYQKSIQDSTREPSGSYKLSMYTDTISGRINYASGKLNLGFQTMYSIMNDKTKPNNDTTTATYTLTPSYNIRNISVSTAFSFNQSQQHLTDLVTDTYTMNLNLRTMFFRERGFFDIGSTYNIVKANNGSVNNRNLNTNFRLAYSIKGLLKGFVNPTIALRGTYLNITDENYSKSNKDEVFIFLVLSTSVPVSF